MANGVNLKKGNVVSEIVGEHIFFRKQIFKLAKSDLIKTYRGAALGWLWAVIKPSVMIFVYWFTFTVGGIRKSGDIFNSTGDSFPFFLWLLAGIIPWFFISEMLNQGTDCIRRYSYLVTKMNFPVSTIPTFVALSKICVNIILIGITVLIFCLFGKFPDIYYLQLPFYILMMFLFSTMLTLFCATLSVISKDFANLVRSFVTAIFWLSAIIWDSSAINNVWFSRFLRVNPVTYITTGFRNTFVYKTWFFEDKTTIYFFVVLTVITVLAFVVYNKVRKDIPDVL